MDLMFIFISIDKTTSNFIDLGRLKANNGNQNYNIPDGTDLAKYNMALIWCKDFSVPVWKCRAKDIT